MEILTPVLLAACLSAVVSYVPLLIWRVVFKRHTGPGFGMYSAAMLMLVGSSSFLGFAVGFLGPIGSHPDSAQSPLLGIFVTGPLGALVGVIGSWAWFYVKRNDA